LNISVIGLGFVGLTTALGFADKGYNVSDYDIDKRYHKKQFIDCRYFLNN